MSCRNVQINKTNIMNEQSIKVRGIAQIRMVHPDGSVYESPWVENIITTVGKAAISGLVGNTGAQTAFGYLALGTSATAVAIGDTTLGAELSTLGLSRAAATVSRVTTTTTNDTLQLLYTWTASGSTTVQEVGIFNAASSGVMLSHLLSGGWAVINGTSLQLTYKVIFA